MDVGTEVKLEAVRQGLQLGNIAKSAGMKRPYFSARVNGHREFLHASSAESDKY